MIMGFENTSRTQANLTITKNFIRPEQALGKTILKTYLEWDILVLRFTDGTFTAVVSEDSHVKPSAGIGDYESLEKAGVLPKGTHQSILDESEAIYKQRTAEARRQTYLEMAKEFGPLSPEEYQ